MPALVLKPSGQRSCRQHRLAGRPAVQRRLRSRITAVGGALLVASLVASCSSDDRTGATAAGQTLRGAGYRFSLPTGWRDMTTEAKKAHGEQVDLVADGPETKGTTTSVWVSVQPSQGETLPYLVAATCKVLK